MSQELNVVIMPNGSLQLEWADIKKAVNKSSDLLQKEVFNRLTPNSYSWLLFLGFCNKDISFSPSLDYWRNFAGFFTKKLSQTPDIENIRHKTEISIKKGEILIHLNNAPLMTGSEYLSTDLLESVWKILNDSFNQEIETYKGTVEDFIKNYSPDVHLIGRVFFHLVENKSDEFPFAFLATYSTRLSEQGKSKHLPLKYALDEYKNDNEKLLELLATVYLTAKQSHLINELIENGEIFQPIVLKANDAFSFLKEIPLYEKSGILCRIPNWWKGNTSNIKINVYVGDTKPSHVNMDSILSFNPYLSLGDMEISIEEARALLNESEGLAFIKNKWVTVDHNKLKQTIDAYEKARKLMKKEGISLKDALRLQLNPEKLLGPDVSEIDCAVSNGEWLESVFQKLLNPEKIVSIKPDKSFKAQLRDYQQKGLNWLSFLNSLQFGACLADDMGLGKTIQLLALLSTIKLSFKKSKKKRKACLLIIPASLISNWANEILKFAPTMKYFIAHPGAGTTKKIVPENEDSLSKYDLIITTYALVQKYEWLQTYSWQIIILDEAQAIKNSGTKQAKAIKRLNSSNRIIMTGTPIENRLSDLWSLFDFLNPGLLGTFSEFQQFVKELKDDSSGFKKLRKLIKPYILRRLKTDKSVISDLPDKVEMKTYVTMSKKQILLYKNLVAEIKKVIEDEDDEKKVKGIAKKGIILASLLKFKQLCNHPDQYLGQDRYDEKLSGKFLRLHEICETIYEKREKVLVFTQFKEITKPLAEFLKTIFGRNGLVLHGSVPVSKRKKIIEQFQSNEYVPFMVLSLKAGGVGLNLTEANHVIHFDRWWNPAVENQATDRVFRIGQKKNVIVHKFITKGTVEEKIDLMLEEKTKLSKDVIASTGEKWITEMDNKELMNIFKLTL